MSRLITLPLQGVATLTERLELRLERFKQISDLREKLFQRFFRDIADGGGLSFYNGNGYLNGRDEFHLHFDAIRPFCATKRAHRGRKGRLKSIGYNLDQKRPTAWGQFPMFVWIREGPENFRPIASVVRLQPLNCRDMCGAETFEPGRYVSRKFLWRIINGKLSAILNSTGIEQGKFINKIIEGRA
jgi:hypothetical protein